MFGLPIAFAAPAVLFGLIALPVIWWLLRLTPPRPQIEVFPPFRILARLIKREETPHKSPWWLTLLRLVLAAFVILALAEPLLNPRERALLSDGPLAIVIDNGWASASDWDERVKTADALIGDAENAGRTVVLAFTAESRANNIGPFNTADARELLLAAKPRPVPGNRAGTLALVSGVLREAGRGTIAYLSDGLATEGDTAAIEALRGANIGNVVWYDNDEFRKVGLVAVENTASAFNIEAIRSPDDTGRRTVTAGAYDDKGRRIADAQIAFASGAATASAQIALPFELRNDFASLSIDGERSAAATRVLDDGSRRRRIGLISAAEGDQSQPLLSPLFYIRAALEPFADLVEPTTADLSQAIPGVLENRPSVVVLADVETIPQEANAALTQWVRDGGTLIRFAGPRLAARDAAEEDALLPVRLRGGERELGGTLSWTEPQSVADFPPAGPFAGLPAPRDVAVSRQVLAEPSTDLADLTWANLADGTPLVTGKTLGKGTLVLFHVTPQATWSNLPISGTFVEMLRRIVTNSSSSGRAESAAEVRAVSLAPYRIIDAFGQQGSPPPEARPLLSTEAGNTLTLENPPGLYGSEEGVYAHNLLSAQTRFERFTPPELPVPVAAASYASGDTIALKGPLLLGALAMLIADALIVLLLSGAFSGLSRRLRPAAAALIAAVALTATMLPSGGTFASDAKPGDEEAVAAITQTRLAYVVTGNASIDTTSKAGLAGLSMFLESRTALEPGEPAGIDPAKDELAFYPIIYWPIDASAPMPSKEAIARIDAYMQQGGTVLFDTRDQLAGTGGLSGSSSPETQRLRDILSGINVPPLEPVPSDHVLTKAFYILEAFPGRYGPSPLWVEASLDASNADSRPVRTGDGVSPILITGADFAGAWAADEAGEPLYPVASGDPMQRIYAYRAGVNIVMYMLTGNYKSDQVHIPALLERLGQ